MVRSSDIPSLPPDSPAVDRQRLEEAGLAYLARYASSTARLRQILLRHVQRRSTDSAVLTEAKGWIEDLIQRWTANGLLNDADFAERRAGSLHRAGASARKIAAKLNGWGIEQSTIRQTLAEDRDDDAMEIRPGGDLCAAIVFARKRKLGPYGSALRSDDPAIRRRQLAAFARAGFSSAVAHRVLAASDIEELETLPEE